MDRLEIKNLHVEVDGKEILKGINLTVEKGKIYALMGPNGSGKTTLGMVIMGHPKYKVTQGEIFFRGKNLLELTPDERAKLGIYLAFQYPMEIEGVQFSHFLWTSIVERRKNNGQKYPSNPIDFRKELKKYIEQLKLRYEFIDRYLNVGFSGGEKKRAEILQMLVLKPEIAILDETDSGLDIDSIKVVADAVNSMRSPEFSALLITHYQRILQYIVPDVVHVMIGGKIIMSGDASLVDVLEKEGYEKFNNLAMEVNQNAG